MSEPTSTAELLKSDLSRHSPMMAQYLGMTFPAFAGKAFKAILLVAAPS